MINSILDRCPLECIPVGAAIVNAAILGPLAILANDARIGWLGGIVSAGCLVAAAISIVWQKRDKRKHEAS